MAHTPVERLGWKPNPHEGQQRWVPESLKRVGSAVEPGADIGVRSERDVHHWRLNNYC